MKKKYIAIVLVVIFLWLAAGVIDFALVHSYHKPLFSICIEPMQDGGSGKYAGLGYSFDIEGNFTPDSADYGVTSYRGYILRKQVIRGFWERMLVSDQYHFSKMNFDVSFANWTSDSNFYAASLNREKFIESSKLHFPIFLFQSMEELNQFKQDYDDTLSMNQSWDEVSSFEEVIAHLDASFFQKNSLVLIYVSSNNCTHRFKVSDVEENHNELVFLVEETTHAELVDTAMAGWFITAEIPNDLFTEETKLDAVMY